MVSDIDQFGRDTTRNNNPSFNEEKSKKILDSLAEIKNQLENKDYNPNVDDSSPKIKISNSKNKSDFDELKSNPYIFLDKIKDYLKANYSKNKISLNVVHKSWSEKQLIFLKKFCKIFKKNPPEYYADDKIRHWLFYRPWWLLFHLVMYIGYFIPKSFISKRPLIDKEYLKKCMKKYDNDWKEIVKLSKS